MIRSFELRWNDTEEVYFGSELRQNVVECLTSGARHMESMGHYSQSAYQRDVWRVSVYEICSVPSPHDWWYWCVFKDRLPLPAQRAATYEIVWGSPQNILTVSDTLVSNKYKNTCIGVCTTGTTSLLTIALWAMRVKLVHMAEYYKPQLLSSGGVSFCRLANNKSLTHSVEVFSLLGFHWACFFFSVHLGEKKDFPAWRLVMQSDMSGGYVITE